MATLPDLTSYLDEYLRIAEVPDAGTALNGLQVENQGEVARLVAAVDASQATIDGVIDSLAAAPGPVLLLVHHGLFWDGLQPMTGRRYRRLGRLMAHDVALYSAHIPLDVHPEVGNNAILARELGLADLEPFGDYKGVPLGFAGTLAISRDELVRRVDALLGTATQLLPGGPEEVRRLGIISGAAGNQIAAALEIGCDSFLTGEGSHHTYFDAMELGVNVLYAGHYATEQVGVKALAAHLSNRFGLPWAFHHHPTGL